MSEVFIQLLLEAIAAAIGKAIENGLTYLIRKVVDEAGRTVTEIYYQFDSDGDGINDSDQVIYRLDTLIPDLDGGFCLVNSGNDIGLGYPGVKLLDANDVFPVLSDLDTHISTGDSFLVDFDADGAVDDVLRPLPYDTTGDGLPDFEIVVDDDDNGLPDLCPDSPFYPIGSEGYQEIVEQRSDNVPALDKSFHNYTVSEALLFLIAFCAGIGVISKIIRRRKL